MSYRDHIKVETVPEARARVMASLEEGTECPCCGQRVKLYPRKLNSTMAACLIGLVRVFEGTQDWVNISNIPLRGTDARTAGGELAKLAHWGLIKGMENDDPKKRTSGFWKPTAKGIKFVKNKLRVPSHVYIYNNRVKCVSTTTTSVVESLRDHFDYEELMNG